MGVRLLRFSSVGDASDFATIYGVASRDFKINNKDALVSLGIGTGGFRTKSDIRFKSKINQIYLVVLV